MTDSIEAALWRGISASERARILADPAPHLAYLTARIGEREIKGAKHNPLIVAMGKAAGIGWWNNDEDAWCAVANNGAVVAVGGEGTRSAMARSFADPKYGTRLAYPVRGAIGAIPRPGSSWTGHTFIIERVSADGQTFYVVNGNVDDQIKRSMVAARSLLPNGLCWPAGIPLTPEAKAAAGLPSNDAAPAAVEAYRAGRRSTSSVLRFGSSGPAVAELKTRYLIPLGADLTGTDYFGANTKRAVERLQERLGVAVDGVVGPMTRAALESALADKAAADTARKAAKTPTVTAGALGTVGGGVAVTAVTTATSAAGQLKGLWDGTALGLVFVALVLLVLGGVGWLVYRQSTARAAAEAEERAA